MGGGAREAVRDSVNKWGSVTKWAQEVLRGEVQGRRHSEYEEHTRRGINTPTRCGGDGYLGSWRLWLCGGHGMAAAASWRIWQC